MKTAGWILIILSGLVILYNVATTKENERIATYNRQTAEDNPIFTIFTDGANLLPTKQAQNFLPPFTGFEVTVIALAVIGIVLVRCSKAKPQAVSTVSAKVIINCPSCSQKLRVPLSVGRIRVNCASCQHAFFYDTGKS